MAFQRAKDILDQARKFHLTIADFYASYKDRAHKPKVKMLLDYMSIHERDLAEGLQIFEDDEVSHHILDVWFKYVPDFTATECFHKLKPLSPDMELDDIIQTVLQLDQCLINLYRDVAEKSPNAKVKEMFQSLLKLEENEEREFLRNTVYLEQCC